MITIGKAFQPIWLDVELGEDSLQVCYRRPTFQEQCDDMNGADGMWTERRLAIIEDWAGVVDANNRAVEYNRKHLASLATSNPLLFRQVINLANQVFSGVITETPSKDEGNEGEAEEPETKPGE